MEIPSQHANLSSAVSPLTKHISTHKNPSVYAKGDSGTTYHYIREEDSHILTDIKSIVSKYIMLPDKSTIQDTCAENLPLLSPISVERRREKIPPGLKSVSLIPLEKFCDDGCNVVNLIILKVLK